MQCERCGAQLSSTPAGGLCPNCVLRTVLDSGAGALGPAAGTMAALPRLRYFGDYELLEEVARGGMGVVYRARQLSLDRIVAVKMMRPGVLSTPEEVRRFQTEARLAASLRHPNIVTIHEIGEHDGLYYFSMDYVEGLSLAELAGRGPVPVDDAVRCVRTIASAIHQAHESGILHRDLKPSNVVLDTEGEPHITDFGLAKQITSDATLTMSGAVVGTPGYMSPEQARGQSGDLTAASDVYSLGALFYELLTGRAPFRASTPIETAKLVLESAPAPPSSISAHVPRDVETICLKCLEKDPVRRYTSAAALADDLGRFLAGEPIHARPVGIGQRAWRWCRRNPWPTTAVSALVLLGVVSVAATFLLRQAGKHSPAPTATPQNSLAPPGAPPSPPAATGENTAAASSENPPPAKPPDKSAFASPAPVGPMAPATGRITGFQISSLAGSSDLGDEGPVEKAWMRGPAGIAIDRRGVIYFADAGASEIRKIGLDHIVSRVAGIFEPSAPISSSDGMPALNAHLGGLSAVVLSPGGELYFTEENKVDRIDSGGLLRKVAGMTERGNPDFAGDGGPAVDSRLGHPTGLAFGPDGSLFIVDQGNHRIRRITPDGVIRTVAGNGTVGPGGDGGLATDAQLGANIGDIALDRSGNLYVRDFSNARVRRVTPDGKIATIAGTGVSAYSGDNVPAVQASLGGAQGLAVDSAGNLFIGDQYRIRKVGPNGIITTIAGDGTGGSPTDGAPAADNHIGSPYHLLAGSAGDLFVVDTSHQRIERIDSAGALHIVAANTDVRDGGPATAARLNGPRSVASNAAGEIFIADSGNHRIRKISRDGRIVTVLGTGREDGPGAMPAPRALTFDAQGGLLIGSGPTVSRLSPDGALTIVAGSPTPGYSGDDAPATRAQLNQVTALVCDNSGNILIADGPNSAVRRVSPDGVISTLVGGKKAAQTGALKWPNSLAIDNQGDLLIGDTSDYRVFRFSPGKVLEIVTGSGVNSMTRRVGGENVRPALGAGIGYPWALAVDQAGNTFIGTYSLAWISPDAMLHESLQGNPSSLFLDRDGTLLGTDGNGHIVRYTPLH